MVYMGSKNKYGKYIAPIINKYIKENHITTFIDCMCGGANLVDKINCETVIANDLSPTLIALHQQVQKDSTVLPSSGSREWWDRAYTEYKRLKTCVPLTLEAWNKESQMPLWEIGAIEWYSSFARGGFSRGYAKTTSERDYYNEAYRNHLKQAEELKYQKIIFTQGNYIDLKIPQNVLLYFDAPYKGTKPYTINTNFNYDEYYDWLRKQSKNNPIFISEQSMPEDFNVIWSKDDCNRTCGLSSNFKACEKLFFIYGENSSLKIG